MLQLFHLVTEKKKKTYKWKVLTTGEDTEGIVSIATKVLVPFFF